MVLKFKIVLQTFLLLSIFTFFLGGVYPLGIYLVNQFLFPKEANNSLIISKGKIVGSALRGQAFYGPDCFWGRMNNHEGGGLQRMKNFNQMQNKHALPVIDALSVFPADFISSSASYLDPHISLKSATIQIDRVSKETKKSREILEKYIALSTEPRQFGFMGQSRVNVVKLNVLLKEEEEQVEKRDKNE